MNGDTLELAKNAYQPLQIVVLYNSYSCKECFYEVRKAVSGIVADKSIMIRTQENMIISRKRLGKEVRRIFPKYQLYFDIHSTYDDKFPPSYTDGVFGEYHVAKTPALLLLSNNSHKIIYLPFENLFQTQLDLPLDQKINNAIAAMK